MLRPQNMQKSLVWCALLALPAAIGLAQPAQAATFTSQFLSGSTVGSEVLNLASPGQVLGGGTAFQYNTINDTTGNKLTTDDGGAKDFTLLGASTASKLGTATVTLSPGGDSGCVRDNHSFTVAPTANNPGSIDSNMFTLLFNSNLTVTKASFNFSSLNTKGIAWEYSVLQFLDTAGNPFSALTDPGWTLGAASQYGSSPGFSGAAGIGNFIAASKGTVTGVGTSQSAAGASGVDDNIAVLDYVLVGLTPGTQIGGIRWTTYLEDVRGTNNSDTNFTSSLLDFTISGNTAEAEAVPTPALLPGLMALVIGARRRSKAAQ
jgi:hypothetical protein